MYRICLLLVLILSVVKGNAQNQPMLKINAGHTGFVNTVSISPDGKYILSGSTDNTIRLWEIVSGKEIKSFIGHRGSVNSVCFSPDGTSIVSGSSDNTIKLWDLTTGKEIKTFNGHEESVNSVSFSSDGESILSCSDDRTVKLFNIKNSGTTVTLTKDYKLEKKDNGIKTFSHHIKAINAVCFSPNGKYFLSGSDDGTVALVKANSGKIEKTFSFLYNEVKSVCFSPDGCYVFAGGSKGLIKQWEIKTGQESNSYSGHKNSVNSLCFSPDGKHLLAGSSDKTIKLFDVTNGLEYKTLNNVSGSVNSVAYSNDGSFFVSGADDRSIKIWNLNIGDNCRVLPGYNISIRSVDISTDGQYLLTTSGNGFINIWDLRSGKVIRSISEYDKTLQPENPNSGKEIRSFKGSKGLVNSFCFSPDGKSLLSGIDTRTLKIWDNKTGKELQSLSGHTDVVYSACFSSDGAYILSGAADKTVKLWDRRTGNEIISFTEHGLHVTSVCFSSDSKFALSASLDNSVILWDIAKRKIVRSFFHGNNSPVSAVCFSPDNKHLASLSFDKKLRIWDLTKNNQPDRTIEIDAKCLSLCYSPDGKIVYIGCLDGSVRVININETDYDIATFITDGTKWLTYTKDMYFDCSAGGEEFLAILVNNHGYNIDQFAIRNNRPDIILQRLGNTDNELIKYYTSLYKKRIKKAGFSEDQLLTDLHVPLAMVSNVKQAGKFATVDFTLSDDRYSLRRYNIFVNNVSLYGTYGQTIAGGNNITLSEKIELTNGVNKIEISCINERGAESFRALTYVESKQIEKGNLYVLTFGVSKYQDTTMNLQYADKDAKDLAAVFEKMRSSGFYDHVYSKVVLNEEVTPSAIKAAKDFAKNAGVDDIFVLFIAGHGTHDHDTEATYYFLTANADATNLKNTAADFETIEDLLQGIKPRNKLFLIDACESGEIDDEVQTNYISLAGARGFYSKGVKSGSFYTSNFEKAKRTYLFEKDRYIYNDLSRRSGAIVFSSSKGGELSFERSDIQNGLFTESIINALTSNAADKNNDGIISTSELRDYVILNVSNTSKDLQHPTVDRDNIFQKFGFPISK